MEAKTNLKMFISNRSGATLLPAKQQHNGWIHCATCLNACGHSNRKIGRQFNRDHRLVWRALRRRGLRSAKAPNEVRALLERTSKFACACCLSRVGFGHKWTARFLMAKRGDVMKWHRQAGIPTRTGSISHRHGRRRKPIDPAQSGTVTRTEIAEI